MTADGQALLPRSVNFDLANNQAEQSIYLCNRNGPNDYTEVGSAAFFRALRNGNFDEILVFIHGYNSLPEEAVFPRAQELQALFNAKGGLSVLVIPLIWPCDTDLGVVQDYFDDQKAADASGYAYMRLIEKFFSWRETNSNDQIPCTKRINILAHSMGNRVLRETLRLTHRYYQPTGLPLMFRNTFMVAADVVNETLEFGEEGEFIAQASRNVAVYFAADDLALRASKVANVRNDIASRRLGHTGPERMAETAKNVYAIDCNDFNRDYDDPLGHSYFTLNPQRQPGVVFEHIWTCIQTGRVPNSETGIRTHILSN